jgi:hypothetical protein
MDSGPSAAFAEASEGKVSTSQKRSPAGSCVIFFSATGLMTNFGSAARAAPVEESGNDPVATSDRISATAPGQREMNRFMASLLVLRHRHGTRRCTGLAFRMPCFALEAGLMSPWSRLC